MLKRIQVLEDGRVSAKEARNWRIVRRKKRTTRKEYQRLLLNHFEMEDYFVQKGLWYLAREKILRERGALPMEEGDATREYMAMHEENFLSSWSREDGREKEERTVDMSNENEEERGEKRRREGEKEENETGLLKEDVTVLLLWNHLQSLVKGEIWRVVEIFLGKTSWISLRTCLVVSRMLGWLCLW